jgi:hypothetical protein
VKINRDRDLLGLIILRNHKQTQFLLAFSLSSRLTFTISVNTSFCVSIPFCSGQKVEMVVDRLCIEGCATLDTQRKEGHILH